jgi:uncharacterized protein with PIN domain
MTICPKCGGHLGKVHRTLAERPIFSGAYACPKCKFRFRQFQPWWYTTYRFVFSQYTLCLRCGTYRVHRVNKRDRLDQVSRHPFSLIQQVFGAPRNKCPFCRLQYHDVRPFGPAAQP